MAKMIGRMHSEQVFLSQCGVLGFGGHHLLSLRHESLDFRRLQVLRAAGAAEAAGLGGREPAPQLRGSAAGEAAAGAQHQQNGASDAADCDCSSKQQPSCSGL